MTERGRFEKWAAANKLPLHKDHQDQYGSAMTRCAWDAWQAALKRR